MPKNLEYPFSSTEQEALRTHGPAAAIQHMLAERLEEADDMDNFRHDITNERYKRYQQLLAFVRSVALGIITPDHPLSGLQPEEAQTLLQKEKASLEGEILFYHSLCLSETAL